MRARRLDNEWSLLARLAEYNPGIVEVVRREVLPDADVFHVVLHRTSALTLQPPHALMEAASHVARFRYPSYYPSVPIEAFLETPVFHPNIHPENGFVCLWDRFSKGDTILEALRQLQRVVTWELWNDHPDHVMQPEALIRTRQDRVALRCDPLRVPTELKLERSYARRPGGLGRKRLSL